MASPPDDDSGVPLVYETVVASSLQVSIVTFRPDWQLLERCLRKLALAVGAARESGVVRTVNVALIDNSANRGIAAKVIELGKTRFADSGVQMTYLHGHANIGYGAAHNLVLHGSGADYHLVLNPDVELASDALLNAVRWMNAHPEVGAIAPLVRRRDGSRDYLVKRKPAVFDLALRGFAPGFLRRAFDARLARYEMRDLPLDRPTVGEFIVSGSFMLFRRDPVAALGGFCERFFLYFEDFDLSLRLARAGKIAFVPRVRIVHYGGDAARKGLRHVAMFASSGLKFFNAHGWKWA